MLDLNGKVALVTGGSRGFGKATSQLLAREGVQVIIASITDEDVLTSVQKVKQCQDHFFMDVTRPQDWDKVYDFVKRKYGRLDMLLNFAGGGVSILPTADQPIEKIDYTIKLNLNSVIYAARVFAPMFKEQKSGTIINFASACAKEAWPDWSVYAASKWGVLGFSKGLYLELQPYNVRVTCVIPGAGRTGFQQSAGIAAIDFGLQPEDLAQVVCDICKLPSNVVIEDVTVWSIDQVVVPLSR